MIASTPFATAVQMVVVARRMSTSTTMKSPFVRMSWNSPGEKQTSTDLFSCNSAILSSGKARLRIPVGGNVVGPAGLEPATGRL